jgi:hypothetical protein
VECFEPLLTIDNFVPVDARRNTVQRVKAPECGYSNSDKEGKGGSDFCPHAVLRVSSYEMQNLQFRRSSQASVHPGFPNATSSPSTLKRPEKCKAPGSAPTAKPGARDTDGDWQIRRSTNTALTSALPLILSSLGRGPYKRALASAYASAPSLRSLSFGMDHLLSSVAGMIESAPGGVKKNRVFGREVTYGTARSLPASGGRRGPETSARRRARSAPS